METMTSTVPRDRITGSRVKIKNQNKHGAYSRLGAQNYFIGGWGGRLFEAGRLLIFPT